MEREPTLHSSATHWPVVLFVAGRTKLSGVPTNVLNTGIHDSDYNDDITTVEVSLLHLLYETQSSQLIRSTLYSHAPVGNISLLVIILHWTGLLLDTVLLTALVHGEYV